MTLKEGYVCCAGLIGPIFLQDTINSERYAG